MTITTVEGDKDAVVTFGQFDFLDLIAANFGRINVDPPDINLIHICLWRAVDLDLLEKALHCRSSAHLEYDWMVFIDSFEALAWSVPVCRVWYILFSEPSFQDRATCLSEHLFPSASKHRPQFVHRDILRHRMRSEIDLH